MGGPGAGYLSSFEGFQALDRTAMRGASAHTGHFLIGGTEG